MSYDRRRLRGHHPAACTCADCVERRAGGSGRRSRRAPARVSIPRLNNPTTRTGDPAVPSQPAPRPVQRPATAPQSSQAQENSGSPSVRAVRVALAIGLACVVAAIAWCAGAF